MRAPQPDRKLPLPAPRLDQARYFPGCVVLLSCGGCGWRRRYDPLRIAHRLYTLRDGGLQTPVADVADTAMGIQFGLINRAVSLRGIQIGLVNLIEEGPVTFFPIVNAAF